MRVVLSALCLLLGSLVVQGQVKTRPVANTTLPKNVQYQGKAVQAMQYQDATGNYLALITQTGSQPQKGEDDSRQAHLYAYVYHMNGNSVASQLWQMHDMVTDCNLDMIANFIPGTFAVTDLDKNGKAEVWVMYRTVCRGDVSPADLKIIMHEGSTKYAMRGVGKIKVGNRLQPDGGTISSNDFKKGPAVFAQYASRLWQKNLTEGM